MRLRLPHRHHWRVVFPALFGSSRCGYVDCVGCEARDVTGPDRYAPWAWRWIHFGEAPPPNRWTY